MRLKRAAEIFAWVAGATLASATTQAQKPPAISPSRTATGTRTASLEGDWTGALEVGETELQLVLHLFKDARGEWRAKLDSLNQAVYGIEASKVTREEDTLRLEIASVGAKFQGKIEADHHAIRGLWEQGGMGLPLKFEKRMAGIRAHAAANIISKVEGTWQGAMEVTNMRMRMQMHVSHDDKGNLLASLDSLDQGIQGIPASKVTEKNEELRFVIPMFQAEYRGTLSATKNELAGEWTQNDNVEKLDFRRSDQPLELRRPQNPAKPYPYAVEDMTFRSGDGKATLAATLTVPRGTGPFAAAVLIGEGPADRDATTAGHKPFLVLADLLTRNGIVVLRYDKRGTAQSTGSSEQATMRDLTSDADTALTYLKARKEVDAKRVGVIGLGEGGILAAEVAARNSDLDWLMLLATPATTGERTLLRQSELIARTGGLPEEQIARGQQFDRQAYAAVREEKTASTLEARLNGLIEKSGLNASMPPSALQAQIRLMTTPWFREYLDFDPAPVLEKIKCAVLALNGDRDLQVDADETVPLLRQAYEKSGNKDFTVLEIQGVNHLFQKAQSGSPALYGAIEETMAPEVQNAITGWVAKHTAQ
jgi:pimeloyl-ACP methyl ester carboxylesterase